MKGSTLLDLSLIKREDDMLSAKLTPPNSPFKVRCYGRVSLFLTNSIFCSCVTNFWRSKCLKMGLIKNCECLFYVLGKTKHGSNFERVSLGVSTAKTAFMVPTYAGYMFTVRLSNNANAQMMVFNFGEEESITFSVKASHGSVSPAKQTLTVRKNAFIQFQYSAPNDSKLVGTTARITVSAQRDVSKEEFSSTFSLLIV